MIKHIKAKEILYYFSVLAIILSSGANILIRNIVVLVTCCAMLLIHKQKVKHSYLMIACTIIGFIVINSCILNTAPTNYKELIMMVIRILCCVVVASYINVEKFRKIFVRIIVSLALFSLLCYGFYFLFHTLPGITAKEGWVGTFYHTVGHGASVGSVSRLRNCGIFGEPGLFQMYLNLAIIALLEEREVNNKTLRKCFWLLTVTIMSTFSSMGYLIYLLVVCIVYIKRSELLSRFITKGKKTRIALIVALVQFGVLFEIKSGEITKFIVQTNSYASRHDDTILSFLIAKSHPIVGIGLATDPLPLWNIYYARFADLRIYQSYQNAMSNGLGNFAMMAGIPFTLMYMTLMLRAFNKMFRVDAKAEKILMCIILFLIAMEEPYLTTPFFLISFFYYKAKNQNCTVLTSEKG